MNLHTQEELAARYQNQPWIVRRWRDRWLLLVPWKLASWYLYDLGYSPNFGDSFELKLDLILGIIDGKRDWWFTSEEVGLRELEKRT